MNGGISRSLVPTQLAAICAPALSLAPLRPAPNRTLDQPTWLFVRQLVTRMTWITASLVLSFIS